MIMQPLDFEAEDEGQIDEPVIRKSSELVSLATIKPIATDWLWLQRIPRGAQTISTGWPGVGKSQQQCDIVAHTSTGTRQLTVSVRRYDYAHL
jgi:hypothetical protein